MSKKNEDWINPFVEFKLRMSAVNRINELISKEEPKPMKKFEHMDNTSTPICPRCEAFLVPLIEYCSQCGQHIDKDNYEL